MRLGSQKILFSEVERPQMRYENFETFQVNLEADPTTVHLDLDTNIGAF